MENVQIPSKFFDDMVKKQDFLKITNLQKVKKLPLKAKFFISNLKTFFKNVLKNHLVLTLLSNVKTTYSKDVFKFCGRLRIYEL